MTTKPLKRTWKVKLRSFLKAPFFVRRIVGDSMLPVLHKEQLVIATPFKKTKQGDIVVACIDNRDVIKRVAKISQGKVWLEGDNQSASTDSRRYGWIDRDTIRGVVIYPLR